MTTQLEQAWELAKQRFAAVGIDVEEALRQLDRLPVSMHCWQGDDVSGFENPEGSLTGGIQATGNYPGKARNASELRTDLEQAMRLIPGPKRLNLHAIYLESDTPVSRDQIKPEHFKNWVEWAKANQLGLDFNPSCFSHPLSADGFTLSHADDSIRQFWIDHCKASRRVSAYFGEQLGTPSVMNIWIPDGMKDITVDRLAPRQRLLAALDEVISEKLNPAHHIDAVESKLFGIGAESYTVGSNEFYMGYATSRQTALCLDAGHFHPTEVISDKISAAMLYVPQLLLHVSRPVRWDSDHVVLLDDETQAIASEIVRHDLFDHIVHMLSRDIDRLTIPSLISRMTTDTFYIYRIVGITQRLGVRAPIMLLGGILITLTMDWVLSLVLIAMLPLMCVLVYLISRKGVPLYAALQRRVDDLVRVVRENASGVRIIKALGKTEHEKERFAQVNTSVAQQETHASVIMAINNPTMQFILNAGLVLVILAGAQRVNSGLTEPGKIVAFLSYFTIILNAMLSITRFLTMYSKALASAHRLQEVLDTELEGSTQPAEPAEPNAPHIQFDHVTFSYNHVSPNVHDVSFSLKKGQTLGILGPTGAGKSTLIRLLLRFYDADSGSIRIDGQDVRSMELSSLRGRIGAVFQNDALFRGEIGENIRLGREITLDEVNDAIRRAQAESFIEEKGGVNSEVQSHGSNFSGGQQQRLLLSRALAGTPDILLLDDATSALDFKTESAFRQALREQSKATTTIIIAQRISAVMHCDQILVMEDGEMLGLGTHEELMQSCPLYQEIAALQIGGEAQ